MGWPLAPPLTPHVKRSSPLGPTGTHAWCSASGRHRPRATRIPRNGPAHVTRPAPERPTARGVEQLLRQRHAMVPSQLRRRNRARHLPSTPTTSRAPTIKAPESARGRFTGRTAACSSAKRADRCDTRLAGVHCSSMIPRNRLFFELHPTSNRAALSKPKKARRPRPRVGWNSSPPRSWWTG